jgi:hypothetical protein
MLYEPISRNGDLRQLRDEGYEVEVSNVYLLINHVPYVNSNKQVAYGTLVSNLEFAGDITVKPSDHVVLWSGEFPCDSRGSQLVKLVNAANLQQQIRDGIVATFSFSQKPVGGYQNYYDKMTTYIRMLEGEARVIDPNATAKTFLVVKPTDDESAFNYMDTASSRAGITAFSERLKNNRIAIIGLGGTGAYVLDFVAKTVVDEIHLFDGDSFLQHNAFRSPGAPSMEELARKPTKVAWFVESYSRMRRRIIPHSLYIDETNVSELKTMNFVFICIDRGEPRRIIVDFLLLNGISFIDAGMGLNIQNDALGGLVRVTTCTPSFHDHVSKRIPFGEGEGNEYSSNIQIAEMNALNAALAVIKWKKIMGFYVDSGNEYNTVFGISENLLTNEEFQNEKKVDQT